MHIKDVYLQLVDVTHLGLLQAGLWKWRRLRSQDDSLIVVLFGFQRASISRDEVSHMNVLALPRLAVCILGVSHVCVSRVEYALRANVRESPQI